MGNKNVVDMTIRANMDISNIGSDISQIQNYLKKIKLSPESKRSFDALFDEATSDLEKIQKRIDKGFKTKGDVTGFEKASSGLDATFKKIENKLFKLYNLSDKELFKLDPSLEKDIRAIEKKFADIGEDFPDTIKANLSKIGDEIDKLGTKAQKKAGQEISDLINSKDYSSALAKAEKQLKNQNAYKYDKNGNVAIGGNTLVTVDKQIAAYENIIKYLKEAVNYQDQFNNKAALLDAEKVERFEQSLKLIRDSLENAQNAANNATTGFQRVSSGIRDAGEETVSFNSELDSIKQRVQYFFSLTNSVALFRRILQDTINTTKELDAAMTETAVVTDFSVADMWKDLSQYTKVAKELGTTIQGVYETMTLYYQQGLKTEEVFEVGTETLKMAKIAGLDYAQATDYMTAALRGFNMEVNEMNAQKVNDVYSELAAITAADTQEIATAMTKTASIASSANMEFETTAAFLSQIIETTRESAETAGTALKTVIARFTELKKDPAEIGEVDGEVVDANKIETALRTIDVALRDTSGQFRDLDDVFLDIAAKWDGLDTNTQRYIATMAAGSRQQSRFIAMMSDYSRTMELVGAANNSAGASQKQFDKTLESLESKLNQLKDAWDQFTMGIANNTLIKAGVDALTSFINVLNKITEKLPGATKGIGNLLLLFGGFKAGGILTRAFSASFLADIVDLSKGAAKAGERSGVSFKDALVAEIKKSKSSISELFKKKEFQLDDDISLKTFANKENDILGKKIGIKGDIARGKRNGEDINKIKELRKELLAINKEEIALDQNLSSYLNASGQQQAAYLALLEGQVPAQQASLALKQNLTKADYKQLAIQSLLNGTNKTESDLTKKEIKERMALIETKRIEALGDKTSLAVKVRETIALLFGNKKRKEEALTRLAAAKATWAQKAAQDGLNSSMFALPIGWILAGIAALIALLVVLDKRFKVQSLEYKMEKAAEATEKAKQAAEGAKQAYDDLNSSIEEIGTAEAELENLTYGTIEWQKALLDVNQQVLDLIDKFPQLKQQLLNELQVEASGKLTLSKEGYELIRKQSLEQYQNAVAGQIVSGSHESFLKKEAALADFNNYDLIGKEINKVTKETEKAGIGERILGSVLANLNTNSDSLFNPVAILSPFMKSAEESQKEQIETSDKAFLYSNTKEALKELTSEEKEQVYSKYIEDPKLFIEGNSELDEFSAGLGIASSALLEFVPAMRKRREAELEYEASVRAQAKQLIFSSTSENFQAKDNSRQIADTFSQFYAKEQDKLIADEASKIDANDLSEYAQNFGINNFTNQGNELKNLQKLYQELTGSTKEQVEEMFGESTEELKKAIASIKVGKDWGKKVENFAIELEKFGDGLENKVIAEQIKNLFGGADGTGFGYGETSGKKIKKTDEEYDALQKLYESSETLQQQFTKFSDFLEWRNSQNKKAHDLEVNTNKQLSALGLIGNEDKPNIEFTTGLDIGSVSGLAQKLIDVFAASGQEGVTELSGKIKNITDEMDPEKADLFASALNGIDWTNKEQVLSFSETLDELGIHIDPTTGNIDQLEQEIIKLAKATTKVSLENLTESIQNLGSIAVDLITKEIDNRSFSKEEVDTLVSTGAIEQKDFAFNVETGDYTYLGESTDRIIAAIREQTSALLGEEEYEKKIESGETVKTLKEEGRFKNIGATNYSKKLDFLEAYNKTMGIYSKEYLERLRKNNGDAAIQEVIDKHYDELINDYLSIESNQKKLDDAKYQGGVTAAQIENTPKELAMRIDKLRGKDGTKISEEDQKQIDIYTAALTNQAEAAGVSQTKIDEYRQALADLDAADSDEEIASLTKKVKELEKELSDTTGFNKTNKAMASTVEKTIDLLDEYEDLKDESSKIQQVQKMVDNFDLGDDIKVDTSNYQDVYDYMLGIARGSHEAYLGLMNLATKEYGVKVTAQGDFTDLNGKFIKMTDNFKDFINLMLQNGQFVEETVTVTNEQDYVGALKKVVGKDGTITYKPIKKKLKVGSQITVVRPKNAGEIKTVSNLGSGGPSYTPSGNSDSGGSGNKWENPYDSFYNINEDINKIVEDRNDLEREHEKILKDETATIQDYSDSYASIIKSYGEEIGLQKELIRLRQQEQADILNKNSDLSKYAWIENGKVQINYEEISKITDEELGNRVEDYISSLENNTDEIEKAEETVDEAEQAARDLMDSWQQDTANFEREVFDAIVYAREQEIEEMESISETLENSASDLVSAIQEEINSRRQERENEETEKDILDKEKRLAYLQQDTSGAYDQEILQLQKELGEQKQDYTDTLIDQKISELEKQNDEAAKQREKQIQLAQYQLKYDQDNGIIAAEVKTLLQNATSEKGWNKVWTLLKNSATYKGLTETEQAVWDKKTQTSFKDALAFLSSGGEGSLGELLQNSSNNGPSNTPTYNYYPGDDNGNGDGEGKGKDDYVFVDETSGDNNIKGTLMATRKNIKGQTYYKVKNSETKETLWYNAKDMITKDSNKNITIKGNAVGLENIVSNSEELAEKKLIFTTNAPLSEEAMIKKLQSYISTYSPGTVISQETIDGIKCLVFNTDLGKFAYKLSDLKTNMFHGFYQWYFDKGTQVYKQFKTGGLADYTGPAWLDGTKSRPELVLNQKDTQNFLQLKDVLGSFMKNKTSVTNNSQQVGDTNYEISISVEKMTSDYDVEQVANKIKQMISSDASYRNSNLISRLR